MTRRSVMFSIAFEKPMTQPIARSAEAERDAGRARGARAGGGRARRRRGGSRAGSGRKPYANTKRKKICPRNFCVSCAARGAGASRLSADERLVELRRVHREASASRGSARECRGALTCRTNAGGPRRASSVPLAPVGEGAERLEPVRARRPSGLAEVAAEQVAADARDHQARGEARDGDVGPGEQADLVAARGRPSCRGPPRKPPYATRPPWRSAKRSTRTT